MSNEEALGPRFVSGLRIALGLFFVLAGFAKLGALEETSRIIAERGVPGPTLFAIAVGAGEVAGGALLMFDRRVRLVTATLIGFLVPIAYFFHSPIGLSPGAAHINAISLTMDIIVLVALGIVLRSTYPRRIAARR